MNLVDYLTYHYIPSLLSAVQFATTSMVGPHPYAPPLSVRRPNGSAATMRDVVDAAMEARRLVDEESHRRLRQESDRRLNKQG